MGPAPGLDALDLDALDPPFDARGPAERWLFQLHRLGMRPGLQRIERLLHRLGDPQNKMESVVVAGTNGKGTAAIYFDALSRAAGRSTGLYTSPHLLSIRERIQVDGIPITSGDLALLVEECRQDIEETGATFFEALTALTLLHFSRKKVELAVLETGLGGRLDATNAVAARGILLTSVGEDHQHILGASLQEIAREKLGLARPRIPFYLAPLSEEIHRFATDFLREADAEAVDLSTVRPYSETMLQGGPHQEKLAAVVGACYEDLARRNGWPLCPAGEVLSAIRLPCRYEQVGQNPPLILDTAHNSPALASLLTRWSAQGAFTVRILVLGVMRDKKVDSILGLVRRSADRILVTAPQWYRSRPPEDLASAITRAKGGGDSPVEIAGGVRESLERARSLAREIAADGGSVSILVTGSNFTVAEALHRLGIDTITGASYSRRWEEGVPLRVVKPRREDNQMRQEDPR